MLRINNKSLRHSRKGKKMNDVLEAQSLFKEAFPLRRYGSVKEMINAAYRSMAPRLSKEFTHRRIETIWQAKARRIDGEEKDALRRAVIEENRREQQELRARLASLDARLAAVDEDFPVEVLAATRQQESGSGAQAARLGRVHRAGK